MLLSNFTHRQQRRESDCLVACAEMVLHYLGLSINYARIAEILRAGADFTPFSHLRYLEQLGLSTILDMQGDVSLLETSIELGLPVIVAVKTLHWPHWDGIITEHAVLVVGIDQAHDRIYIHDPFLRTGANRNVVN